MKIDERNKMIIYPLNIPIQNGLLKDGLKNLVMNLLKNYVQKIIVGPN